MNQPVIRPWAPGDETSILAAWNRIFPAQDGLPERDLDWWNWEFRDHPLHKTEVVVAEIDGQIVGQYAAIPLAALSEGQPTTLGCIVDAFVLPEFRRAGQRPGLIIHLARRLQELYCGPRAEQGHPGHALLYGYPVPIWRIAQRYLASEMVRDMDLLFRELSCPGFVPVPLPDGFLVEELQDEAELIALADELWAQVAPGMRFGLVRDGAWFSWRYARHPGHRYRFLLVRDAASGSARGLAVWRRGPYAVPDAGIVCDCLCPSDDDAALTALVHGLERFGLEEGAPLLAAVFPQNHPFFLAFQRKGFLVGPPSHFLVMNSFGPHVRWLRDRWFFTLGDSDLV